MKDMVGFLGKVVRESALPSITLSRLQEEFPDGDWKYTDNFVQYQEAFFLQFADASERRMWWVKVEKEWPSLTMTWDISEVPELV